MRILTISNVIKRKRIHLCARACAELEKDATAQPLSWKVIGTGDLLDDVRKVAPASMEFLPRVESLRAHYQEADVFVLPSFDEAFGMVYIESIMCGCPIVATRGEGGDEIVETTGGGVLVDIPRDEDAAVANIVAAVREVGQHRDRYMSNAVVAVAVEMMDPARIRQEWDALIVRCGGDPTRTEPLGW